MVILYFVCFLANFNGVKSQGVIIYFTVLLPIFTIITLIINSARLPGAADGIKE